MILIILIMKAISFKILMARNNTRMIYFSIILIMIFWALISKKSKCKESKNRLLLKSKNSKKRFNGTWSMVDAFSTLVNILVETKK